ncbi:hypothetical protein [Rhodococcus sp. IEGM 1307]|uniref:hypothetical protein n=1 Tax=Rhodococcus sp. IEGM 1307 TaxID=3047091 RepID=UPI0024B726C4|nr:hypothetical protein [Rhodococcus sp. IEGM 1307]MDI9977495.1 hypothetical protein [Rhodococcus sp. IEGM 1307]
MTTAESLLAGPRGRRMLLAYARDAERTLHSEFRSDSFDHAVFLASYHLESGREGARVLFGPGAEEARRTVLTADDVAHRLSQVPLPEVTAVALRSALADAVDAARYWQDPDGEDILVDTEPVRRELRRVAEHIARSPHAQWWTTPAATDQWSVGWSEDDTDPVDSTTTELLRDYRDRTAAEEVRAERDRPADPSANWSGWWWSTPPTRCSSRRLFDGTPAGLWFVEDSMGWERAITRRMNIPAGARVYEVDGAQAWAELCRQFPVEVTAQKRHDWYRTTGRSGRWVIPDWPRLSERYEGVHLTVAGYLAAAGTAIAVDTDTDTDTASVIAGWAPDDTYWLTDTVNLDSDDSRTWVCDTSGRHPSWVGETHR